MAPRHSEYNALPTPAVMHEHRSNRWSSRSGVFLMGGGLACLLGMALVAKTYVLDSTATHRSANRVTQLYGVPPMSYVSGTNDCTGDPAYWRPEIHNFCCEVYGTGPGCRSMSRNAADASSYDPGSLDYDVGRFSDPDYLSGSVDPGYEYETSEVSRADKAVGPYVVHPDGKEFDDDQDFYDCTSIKEEDSLEKLAICCHHGNAGCKQLALKKAAKKKQEDMEKKLKEEKEEKTKEKEDKEKGHEVQSEKKEEKKEVKEKVMEDNKKEAETEKANSSSTTSESEDRTTGSTTSASTAATDAATASTTTTTTTTTSTESTSTTTNEIDWMYELAKEDKVNISMPLPKPGTLRDLDDLIARLHPNSTTLKPWTIPGVHYGPIPHMQFMQ